MIVPEARAHNKYMYESIFVWRSLLGTLLPIHADEPTAMPAWTAFVKPTL